jgi:mercuric ion transport protein
METRENSTKFLATGIIAAIGASLCCITPVLAIVAGIGGVASAFSWLNPFRPFFIGLTILVLGFAWYQKFKPNKEEMACDCEDEKDKKPFFQSRKFLGIATLLAVLLISFPYYAGAFFAEPVKAGTVIEQAVLYQATFDIQGMTCAGCENSVNHVLKSKTGVIEAKADYDKGMAQVAYDPAIITTEVLKTAIEKEVGYQITNIQIIRDKKE